MTVSIRTEAGTVEVRDKKHAMKLITTTCYAHQFTKEEIKTNIRLQELAKSFNIDTEQIATDVNPIVEEHNQGYPMIYFFGHSDY